MSPGELVDAVKADRVLIRKRVERLEAAGFVSLTGVTMSRRIAITAKGVIPRQPSEPATSAATVKRTADLKVRTSAAPSTSPLAVVEERDREVLQLIEHSRGGRTIRELHISRPNDTPMAIEAAVIRLKVKKLIVEDDGRWTAA